eukprot:TRINITY_DN105327_c2_g1_i1.p2 TRINITY_DN105327_c2_g1~~TRINITY_DN105327_c2_g1_i1.p2  ORF type:complete len:385 (-),score=28.94 TRINITY_DN105327_c2_g1_i1:2399-3448(-)
MSSDTETYNEIGPEINLYNLRDMLLARLTNSQKHQVLERCSEKTKEEQKHRNYSNANSTSRSKKSGNTRKGSSGLNSPKSYDLNAEIKEVHEFQLPQTGLEATKVALKTSTGVGNQIACLSLTVATFDTISFVSNKRVIHQEKRKDVPTLKQNALKMVETTAKSQPVSPLRCSLPGRLSQAVTLDGNTGNKCEVLHRERSNNAVNRYELSIANKRVETLRVEAETLKKKLQALENEAIKVLQQKPRNQKAKLLEKWSNEIERHKLILNKNNERLESIHGKALKEKEGIKRDKETCAECEFIIRKLLESREFSGKIASIINFSSHTQSILAAINYAHIQDCEYCESLLQR